MPCCDLCYEKYIHDDGIINLERYSIARSNVNKKLKEEKERMRKIMELRENTGCGSMDCKKALVENDWDIQRARLYLIEKPYNCMGDFVPDVKYEED
jgi:hypothetical protein